MSWSAHTSIAEALESLRSEDIVFKRLTGEQQATVLATIKSRFLDHPNARWWWEHLILPQKTIHGASAEDLPTICPDAQASVWLITCAEDEEIVYSTTPKSAAQILGECPLFEYAVVDSDYDWLMIENHHNSFIVSGDLKILKAINNEPCAAPNGGPAASVENSNAPGGPPSVS